MSYRRDEGTWSRGVLETVECCPACGSAERDARRYRRRDDAGIMPDVWQMVSCANCGSLYLDPRPDAESLPRAYQDYYTHQAEHEDVPGSGAGGVLWSLIHGYLNWRFGMRRAPSNALGALVFLVIEPLRLKLDYYGRHLTRKRFPEPERLLDVGCGNGAFLTRAREMGWQVTGCEPDAKAVAVCQAQGLDVLQGDIFNAALDNRMFDVVTISHVLEHVTNPKALLERAYTLLRPGGTIWVAVPNPGSVGLRIYGSAWRGLHVPFHLCIPSQKQLTLLLLSAKFLLPESMRRGAHTGALWSDSVAIARREGIDLLPGPILGLGRLWADFVSAIGCQAADETVLVARKPRDSQ